jgi:hypothetical protein
VSDCGRLSDRMPLVARDGDRAQAGWTREEAQHLAGCRSCQEEWELVRRTIRLGKDIGLGLDSDDMTRGVLARLERTRVASDRGRRRRWTLTILVAAAAAIVLLIWTGRPVTSPPVQQNATVVARPLLIPLPELDTLQAAELDSVLQGMDEPAGVTLPELDLDNGEVEGVFDFMEG